MTDNPKQTETIGILVVHGMGEQQPEEHLDTVAQYLVRAWQSKYGRSNVLELNSAHDRINESCSTEGGSRRTITILVKSNCATYRETKIEFKEVYWADLDEDPQGSWNQLRHQIAFWCWAFSQWGRKRYKLNDTGLPGSKGMCEPGPVGNGTMLCSRSKLFGVGVAFLLLGMSWELLRFIVRRLRIVIGGSGVLARYLGDVLLYTENRYRYRPSNVKTTDAPRDAIRRRMVGGLLEMSLKSYDRWYILAHSLGSVVAHNALMELAEALPNYLDREQWDRTQQYDHTCKGPETENRKMRPARPPWLANDDAIKRATLFKNLKGFCTYGSPLDKFATLWPAVVPINCDTKPLAGCEWINVYDPMDPVGAELNLYDKSEQFKPRNITYNASPMFLLAHNKYLKRYSTDGFTTRLAQWVVEGECFDSTDSNRFDGGKLRTLLRSALQLAWWIVLSALAASPFIWFVVKATCSDWYSTVFGSDGVVSSFFDWLVKCCSSEFDIDAILGTLGTLAGAIVVIFGICVICARRKP